MATLIENYGFIGNMSGSALVSKEGSIDWLCIPRFDSDACMASLLGRDEHGCWRIFPTSGLKDVARRYRAGTMILETDFECDDGAVRVIDFMPTAPQRHSVIRIIEGLRGKVSLGFLLSVRFGYGKNTPWITRSEGGFRLMVAPDSLVLRSSIPLNAGEHDITTEFTVREGQSVTFELSWQAAHLTPPAPLDPASELKRSTAWWTEWSGRSTYNGRYAEAVNSSLVALKAMIYSPTGGVVAAPTASLPEELGGVRNWDYRFCWLRDAALTVRAFLAGGYVDEASRLRDWLLRAVAGAPEDIQIMYGVEGERRLTEFEVPWLPGYEESKPVHIGNAAHGQFQLDVYGEVVGVFAEAMARGMVQETTGFGWSSLHRNMEFLSTAWQRPDDGVWEMRGGRRHFVSSKIMAWFAVDSFIKIIEMTAQYKGREDRRLLLPQYRTLRARIRSEILERGFNKGLNSFTQSYNSEALDASVLIIPIIGFLPGTDPRFQGTIRAIEKNLMRDGFVRRYSTQLSNDGLAGDEGAFLACSFWLVTAYAMSGRRREAEELFDRLLSLRNDLGLLSEEYDTKSKRLIGNFPQAFSHLALITAATMLSRVEEPAVAPPR